MKENSDELVRLKSLKDSLENSLKDSLEKNNLTETELTKKIEELESQILSLKENSDKNNTQEIERLEREVITELTKKIEELESQIYR